MKRVIKAATENDIYYWNGIDEVPNDVTHVVVEDGVTSIRERAFRFRKDLREVKIPNSVKQIKEYAFADCSSLISANMPDSVIICEEGVFDNCKSLQSMHLSNKLKFLGSSTFRGCKSLRSVTIPSSIKIISSQFVGCESLKSIDLPEGLEEIRSGSFTFCESLESIRIPDSVNYIETKAFARCYNLNYVEISDPSSVNIEPEAFYQCPLQDTPWLLDYMEATKPEPIKKPSKSDLDSDLSEDVRLLAERIMDCLSYESTYSIESEYVDFYPLVISCAEQVLDEYPRIDPGTVSIEFQGAPMDVDCAEIEIGPAYCFLMWSEKKVYINFVPRAYAELEGEWGPMDR